ncbi:MAG: acyl-CoA dehydrogenase family protein [Acidimicrobiales bacterium]
MATSPDEQTARAELRAWLAEWWDPDRPLAEWRRLLVESGWAAPTWPADRYGRGLPEAFAAGLAEEMAAAGAVGPAGGSGMALAAPTLLRHGPEELQRRLLRGILTGEERWCQLFSEPGNGSDLAGLTTRAVRDGDQWIVNGQKVWTTGAKTASYGMLLARTDWDAPKHRGITYFALPMHQDGVEVRPLRQMNNHASFNEVFLTDAVVPHNNIVGQEGDGWAAALTTLAHERNLGANRSAPGAVSAAGRTVREAMAEDGDYLRTYSWYPQRAGRPDLLPSQARESGRADDPLIRQRLADVEIRERVARWNVRRALAARAQGQAPGPEGSLAKLTGTDIARRSSSLHAQIAGPAAMLTGPDSRLGGVVAEIIVSVPAGSIAGGTDEVQHNILGERSLGLPREPSVDADIPFRDVKTNRRN